MPPDSRVNTDARARYAERQATMPRYCPNCSAELRPPAADCWNCGAVFGSDGGWAPTNAPTGRFEEHQKTGNTGAVTTSVQGGAAWQRLLLNVLRALFCVAVSIACVFAGGGALMFTLGIGFYWIAPLVILLFGLSNLFLILLALTAADRRVVQVSAVISFVAGAALMAGSAGASGEQFVSTAAWWVGLFFNWLAIRTIFDSRTTLNASAETLSAPRQNADIRQRRGSR
jgi:hypothetical protein